MPAFPLSVRDPCALATAAFVLVSFWALCKIAYNLFLHPLRSFPGPICHAATRIPFCYKLLRGTQPHDMLQLHEKYGEVVRIAPDELAFSSPDAWKDIMGHRASGEEFAKWAKFYRPMDDLAISIVNAEREYHSRLRRQLAHGFSDKSMREQEPIIKQYVDLLIKRLHENCAGGSKPLDLMAWYNFTTFDVIGDLAFGEPFGCLENSYYHPWVKKIFEMTRVGAVLQVISHFPPIKKFLMFVTPKSVKEEHERQMQLSKEKLLRRMKMEKERPDLIEGLLKKKDEWNMSLDDLEANSTILIIGGSETTATLLSGVSFLLMTNPEALAKLTAEVRSAFKTEDEIDISSVGKLKYMLACLDEALRMYPPVPIGLPRVVPKGGATIAGTQVPEDTIVAVHQWATYHNKENFSDPFSYHPERHLGDAKFTTDRREALQPFHVGPRSCIGRNLAYTEMRLILARVIFNFDMKIADDSKNWMKQKIFLMWEKGPLNVYLTPVVKK